MKEMKDFFTNQIQIFLNDDFVLMQIKRKKGKTLIETCLDLMIRWCPQMNEEGRDTYSFDIIRKLKTHRITIRAAELIGNLIDNYGTEPREVFLERLNDNIHYEHNSPVNEIRIKLAQIKLPTYADVSGILNDGYEVILMTKEESAVLNGSKTKKYALDNENRAGCGLSKSGSAVERLNEIQAGISSPEKTSDLYHRLIERFPS